MLLKKFSFSTVKKDALSCSAMASKKTVRSTNFQYNGLIYEWDDTAMGSLVSVVIANLYMENKQ